MKPFRNIYQLEITNDLSSFSLAAVAKVKSLEDSVIDQKFCYLVSKPEELEVLEQKLTSLFHQHYFKVNQKPLVIFKDEKLLFSFEKLIDDLKLGEVELIIDGKSRNNIYFEVKPTDLDSVFSSKQNGERYFVLDESAQHELNQLLENIDQSKKNQFIEKYSYQLEIGNKINELKVLQEELNIVNESLDAVKTEYKKELNWYKQEIKKIKEWYENEHKNTPSIITKLFKKLF